MAKRVSGVAGFWPDDHKLLEAAKKTHAAGYRKFDSITPFPVHGMDDATGIEESALPWVTFVMGCVGLCAGIFFTYYTSAVDWALIVGGKPFFSLPAFVPVLFEMTVFFAAHSSVVATIILCELPKVNPPIIDPDLTSHKFALFVPQDDVGYDAAKVEQFFKSIGATEVKRVAEF